ncbi:MAG: LysM peptidoglycan-binding domain-containing protein [Simkania negevensis]|nr:LysM peptidoglycan-binding domain-containing protein [Simkania negevensis]
MMRIKRILLFPALLFTGCAAINSSPKEEKHQMELSLHKLRTDVEEIKHDLNTYEIEYHVLEGKLTDQDHLIDSLKKQLYELKKSKVESFAESVAKIESTILSLSKQQEKILADIRQLSSHANETTTALSQYKEKIASFEQSVSAQKEQIKEIIKLKTLMSQLSPNEPKEKRVHKVQPGDSLEKIARDYGLSVEEIKKFNHLSSDLIVVGQDLKLSLGPE